MLWIKAFHIISIIAWMAMLLYLPRLMVYHADVATGTAQSETFKIMEGRLLRFIGWPALVLSWGFGLYLLIDQGLLGHGEIWIHIKLTIVIILSLFHMRLAWHVKQFKHDQNHSSARYFRIINEIPTFLMVMIVILAVVRPF